MAVNPITRLRVDSFGPLHNVDLTLGKGLNVITGDNGTGKSQILKLLYSAVTTVTDDSSLTKSTLATSLANKLTGVFRPDSLGRLARRVQGRARAEIEVKFAGIAAPLSFSFSSNSRSEVRIDSAPGKAVGDTPVFLPSRELLSLYPGLAALYDTRETEFDETWRDTALLLGRSALRGPRGDLANSILAPLFEVLEGRVVDVQGRFYVNLPTSESGSANVEAHLVSEGFRKLAMVIRLVSSGVLLEGGYLFWDEPEANLNPATQRAVARAITLLVEHGTQVFVATHSVFLLRELELIMEESPLLDESVTYVGLYRESANASGVRAETASDPADLSSVTALEEEARQSLRYLGIAADDNRS